MGFAANHEDSISALFSATQSHVLQAIFLERGSSGVSFTDIVRAAGGGYGGVKRVLDRFEKAGLVEPQQLGNQKRYRPNIGHPLHREIKSMLVKTVGVAGRVRHALEPLESDIDLAFIFGSVARSEERPDSDLDLAVIGRATLYDLSPAIETVGAEIGREVHLVIVETFSEFARMIQLRLSGQALEQWASRETIPVLGSWEGMRPS